jgi:hypothetical protein
MPDKYLPLAMKLYAVFLIVYAVVGLAVVWWERR